MIRMLSSMKMVKDLMDSPLSVDQINHYLDLYTSMGATHVDVPPVIGHPNYVMVVKRWLDACHLKNLSVVLRSAHQNMEFERNPDGSLKIRPDGHVSGLYGAISYVGVDRKPQQFWVDEAVAAINAIKSSLKTGDMIAFYPERTEGIFSDATSFLTPYKDPVVYATFFISLNAACRGVVPQGVIVGMAANNASELLSGWMPQNLINDCGVVAIDHYVDGNPTQYEADVRAIKLRYNKQVFVEEGAPDRFIVPTRVQIDAYYAVNKKLEVDGVLYGYGSWSGWTGAPESTITDTGLTDNGLSLQAWWVEVTPVPTPTPSTDVATQLIRIEGKFDEQRVKLDTALSIQTAVAKQVKDVHDILWNTTDTNTVKVNKAKLIIPK